MSNEPSNQEPTNPESTDSDAVFGGLPTGDVPADDFASSMSEADDYNMADDFTSTGDFTATGDYSAPGDFTASGDAVGEDGEAFAETTGGGTATMAPPPPPPTPAPRRLVRDPYARLGGVASGLGHHYGIDVSVVRIIFVLGALASGFGLLVYLLAWLVIPRADYWPPAGQPRPLRSLSGRDLGLGLAVVGLMVALGFGAAGATGSILIPLVLVGGGVWLMVQPPSVNASTAGTETMAGYSAGGVGTPPPPAAGGYGPTGPGGAPVPPRSRKRRWGVVAVIGGLLFAVFVLPFLAIIAFVSVLATGDVEFDSIGGDPIVFNPTTVSAIPNEIIEDGGELEIDLTDLDAADFADLDEPVEIDATVDFGKIKIIVPNDIDVSVNASAGVGDVTVFGVNQDGFGAEIVDSDADADIELDLNVDLGEIEVVNG